jgi:hypothetical protein
MIDFVFQVQKWDLEIESISKKTFVKTSEVDQELGCVMHQEIQGNDWERHGLAPHDDYSYHSLLL